MQTTPKKKRKSNADCSPEELQEKQKVCTHSQHKVIRLTEGQSSKPELQS